MLKGSRGSSASDVPIHYCVHDLLDVNQPEHRASLRRASNRTRPRDAASPDPAEFKSLRVKTRIYWEDESKKTDTKQKLVEKLCEAVTKRLGELLMVVPSTSFTVPNGGSENCQRFPATNIDDADLVIDVIPGDTESEDVLGAATPCSFNADRRNVHGFFFVKESELKPENFIFLKGLFLHEVTHVLGFSQNQFSESIFDGKIEEITTPDNTKKKAFVFNSILSYAKEYFGCSSLTGVEIEDDGGDGTAGSHFEKRQLMNEIMTGSSSQIPSYSLFTLLVLEALGYYKVNKTAADPFGFGYKRGCDFATTCSKSAWGALYCTENNAQGCSADLTARGICNIKDGKGTDVLADECPYYLSYPKKSCAVTRDSISGETFGEDSRCFLGSLLKNSPLLGASRNGYCYRVKCLSDTVAKVNVGGVWVTCNSGEVVTVPGYGGQLECPAVARICHGGQYASTDSFPVFEAVKPSSGGSGTRVTVTGKNFNTKHGMKVEIGTRACRDVSVESPTQLTCTVDKSTSFVEFFMRDRRSVVVTDLYTSLSDVGVDSFLYTTSLSDFNEALSHMFSKYTFLCICIIVCIVALLVVFVFLVKQCLFPRRPRRITYDEMEKYNRELEESEKRSQDGARKRRKEKNE